MENKKEIIPIVLAGDLSDRVQVFIDGETADLYQELVIEQFGHEDKKYTIQAISRFRPQQLEIEVPPIESPVHSSVIASVLKKYGKLEDVAIDDPYYVDWHLTLESQTWVTYFTLYEDWTVNVMVLFFEEMKYGINTILSTLTLENNRVGSLEQFFEHVSTYKQK